jgi:thiol-disulfide isomerase/thioredoxin
MVIQRLSHLMLALSFLILCSAAQSQTTLNFHVTDLGAEDECYLAYYYGDKQYIRDTFQLDAQGRGKVSSSEIIPSGIYLLVFPDKSYLEFLYDRGNLSLKLSAQDPVGTAAFTNSISNKALIGFNRLIAEMRVESGALNEGRTDENEEVTNKKLAEIDAKISAYKQKIFKDHPYEMVTALLKAIEDPIIPTDITGDTERYVYYKSHYFDNIDFSEGWLIRTPFFHSKIMGYLDRLTVQHHDSIIKSVDEIIARTKGNDELFKYAVLTCLNKYVSAQFMTATNIYVHIVEKYYLTGLATWADEETMSKMRTAYDNSIHNIVGARAKLPWLKTYDDVRFNFTPDTYTVIFFWDQRSSFCTDAADELMDFYANKAQDIEVVAIHVGDIMDYKAFIKFEKYKWPHTTATNYEFKDDFYVRSTPAIYLLDKDNIIIGRRISVNQIQDIIDFDRK